MAPEGTEQIAPEVDTERELARRLAHTPRDPWAVCADDTEDTEAGEHATYPPLAGANGMKAMKPRKPG